MRRDTEKKVFTPPCLGTAKGFGILFSESNLSKISRMSENLRLSLLLHVSEFKSSMIFTG